MEFRLLCSVTMATLAHHQGPAKDNSVRQHASVVEQHFNLLHGILPYDFILFHQLSMVLNLYTLNPYNIDIDRITMTQVP